MHVQYLDIMVFGFGKKKAPEEPQIIETKERTIPLGEIATFVKELESPRYSDVISIAQTVKSQVDVSKKNINGLILQLESDDLKLDEIDKNLMIIVKRGKDSVVSIIKKETATKLSDPTKYENVLELNTEINQMLKKIGDVLGLNSRIIHIFAKKYADSLKSEIAEIAKNRNRLQTAINHAENIFSICKKILSQGQEISLINMDILQKTDRLYEVSQQIESQNLNRQALEKQIDGILSTSDYKKYTEIKSKIESSSSEKLQIKNIIDLQFSKISRPLGKYTYISSFEKPVKKLMDELVSDPYEVITRENKDTIVMILQAVSKSVASSSISVKDTDKALEYISETVEKLDEFISMKEKFTSKISIFQNELVSYDINPLEKTKEALKKSLSDLDISKSIKTKLETEINEKNNKLKNMIDQTERNLGSLTNSKITIKL